MRTTIDINDAILKELRNRARERNCSLRAATEEVLLIGLEGQRKKKSSRRFVIKPIDIGIKPGMRNVSLNQLYDQVEAEEQARKL